MIKVAVVILNWNGQKFLEKFLPKVVQFSADFASVFVADNASTDDSVFFLKKSFPEVKVIENSENGGFAKGYNDALSKIDADYYVLLNSDIEVTENWIQPVIELMDSDPKIAACQPKICSFQEPAKFEYAGASGGYIDKLGYPFCRGRLFQSIEEDKGQYDDITEIFWATGACMFVRAKIFHDLGGLDSDFFAHMEEIDFCWRAKNNSYKIMVCPKSVVYHVGGGTLPKSSSRKTYLNFRNDLILLYKNLPSNRLFYVFIIRFILDYIAAIKFLVEGGLMDFVAVVRAHLSFYKSILKNKEKRQRMKHMPVTEVYNGSIVFSYFVKQKKFFSQLKFPR
ncbi:MAG: glycosyltransferase family 2 protein [Bacteroidales bacterium]|nr:glycosyltransferase family 2 protein [Bacteroidales bacterium]